MVFGTVYIAILGSCFVFCWLRLVGRFFVEDVLREVRLFEVFLHEQLSISR